MPFFHLVMNTSARYYERNVATTTALMTMITVIESSRAPMQLTSDNEPTLDMARALDAQGGQHSDDRLLHATKGCMSDAERASAATRQPLCITRRLRDLSI